MTQDKSLDQTASIKPIQRLIQRTRTLLRSSWVLAGVGLTVGLATLTLVAVTGIDLVWPLMPALRLTGLLLVVLPTLWVFGAGVVRPLCRRLTAIVVARRIETHLPGIHNRLVSCVDLSQRRQGQPLSAAFFRRLVDEAVERIRGFRARTVVDGVSLRRAGLFGLTGAAILAGAFLLLSDRLPTAMARIFRPFEDIPPASDVAYSVEPGDAHVLRDEDILLGAGVTRGEPKHLKLEMRGADNRVLWYDLDKQVDGRWTVKLRGLDEGFENSFTYRVHGGGTWSKAYHITVIDRPTIASLRTVVHYPKYMALPPRPNPAGTADVAGPEGSQVEIVVETEGNVAEGHIQLLAGQGKPSTLAVARALPMQAVGENRWSGRFPLDRDGMYRVELRNELGYANRTVREAKYHALPDKPPQITLERPGGDVVLSAPEQVPLVISAGDDYGLDRVVLSYQRNGAGTYVELPLKRYSEPVRSDHFAAALDLRQLKFKVGEWLRYRLEAVDRKGQATFTPEFTIRIANDPNAADRELANLEKGTDTFEEKLSKLIAEQAKVREKLEKLSAHYGKLSDKLQAAKAKADEAHDQQATPNAAPEPLKLDPVSEKALQELRHELAQLSAPANQNVQLGQQVKADLDRLTDQVAKSKLLPEEMARQMRELQKAFERLAMNPLQQLAADMQRGVDPRQRDPGVPDLSRRSDRLQKDLEAMKQRMAALAQARQQMHDNLDKALAQLRNEILKLNAGLTARDFEDLRNALAALREQLQRQTGRQQRLYQDTKDTPNPALASRAKSQADLDKQLKQLLDRVKKLQAADRIKRMKRKPQFPNAPYMPEDDEQLVRPNEEDADEPADHKNASGKQANAKADKNSDDDEEEANFMPALGGPRPKIDPRYAKKMRPLKKKRGPNDDQAADQRENLQSRQSENLADLDAADQSLESDEHALENMLGQLARALAGEPAGAHAGQPHGADNPLADLLQSPSFQQAMAMAARMRQMGQGQDGAGRPPPTGGQNLPEGNLQGRTIDDPAMEAELNQLPLDTRNALLKLQPRLREQLLQGMREKGPDGYRQFIDEYFKRLTETKSPR